MEGLFYIKCFFFLLFSKTISLLQRNDNEVLSSDNQIPSHKHGSNIHSSMGLHDYQTPTNEQITNRSEEITMSAVKTESAEILGHSETNENAKELVYNDNDQRASNKEQLNNNNTAKETVGRDNNHAVETLGSDSQVFSLTLANSLGVDNKGFDCSDKELTFCSLDQVTVANVDEVNMNTVQSKSPEKKHDFVVSETVTNKKLSVVSCDLESALPATSGHKTVRAWLKDPHLYKVFPLFNCQ